MKLINTAILVQPWNWAIIGLLAGFWVLFIVTVFPQPLTNGEK